MRYDLAFLLCCCKSFLGSGDPDEDDYYTLLQVDRDASQEDLKRAYKRQSLQMHPDKLAQRGLTVTPESQAKFTKMKEAYEVLSDPHKRDTYDALGSRGMKWVDEPFSIDPQELAHNFATSSVLDRSKIFGIFVAIGIAVFILPVLVCLHADGAFGDAASWIATLTPLWLWNAFLLFYHSRVILMGPIPRPDHISIEEWVDPLPMKKRIFSMLRFVLIVLFEILVAFKIDQMLVHVPWSVIFIPLYVWEATTLYKKWPLARMRIVTVEDLEVALGKPFSEFTPAEKELIGKRYSVVSSTSSPDFDAAQKLKTRARHDVIKSIFRIAFVVVLLVQLDGGYDWSWWVVFTPFWIISFLICCANYQAFVEVQKMAMDKDPALFAPAKKEGDTAAAATTSYGAVGQDGGATPSETQASSTLSEEEREQLKAQVTASSSKLCNKCCSQGFLLMIIFLFVGKLQGAGFSAFWIISPFLLVAGILLCCIGCAIFGVKEVPTDGVDFESGDFAYMNAEAGTAPGPGADSNSVLSPTVYVPPPPEPQQSPTPPPQSPAPETNPTPIVSEAILVEPRKEDDPPVVDLLDDATDKKSPDVPKKENTQAGEIGELD